MNILKRLSSLFSAIRNDLAFVTLVESFHKKMGLGTIALDKFMLHYLQ